MRPRSAILAALLLVCLLFTGTALVFLGCDDDRQQEVEHLRQENRRIAEKAERDRRILEARKQEAEDDAQAAMLVTAACGIGLAVAICLLVRERHLKQADGPPPKDS